MKSPRRAMTRLFKTHAIGFAAGLLSLTAGFSGVQAQTRPSDAACVSCHLEQTEERLVRPVVRFESDVHRSAGFGCLDCHGVGHEGSDDLNAPGFLAKPSALEVADMCGSCHSDAVFMRGYNPSLRVDQVTEYQTSVHGQRLYEMGDTLVATCVSCHPAHEILPPTNTESSVYPGNVASLCGACHSDPDLMDPRGKLSTQEEEFRASIHGQLMFESGDMSAPTCNDCHGNHGAAPPGLSSVTNVCGQCHTMMAQYFEDSGHTDWFRDEGLAECAACHSNHLIVPPTEATIGLRFDDVCTQCHDPRDPVALEFIAMGRFIEDLQQENEDALAALETAEDAGMEVSNAFFELDEVSTALTRARSAIHSFNYRVVEEELTPGVEATERASARAVEAMDEHRFRRVGLGVFSGIVLVLVLGLILKIRDLDAGSAGPVTGMNQTKESYS